jgi:hypothetical protein
MQFYRISLPVRSLMTQIPGIDDNRMIFALCGLAGDVRSQTGLVLA